MRGAIIIAVLLAAFSAHAFVLMDCEGAQEVSIGSVEELDAQEDVIACELARAPRGTDIFGAFLGNEDVRVMVGEHDMIIRLEDGVLAGAAPAMARPSVEVRCDEALVQSYIDEARWTETFDDVRRVVRECPVRASRLSTVPAVTGLNVMVNQVEAALDLLNGATLSGTARDAATLLFAMPLTLVEFSVQFVGAAL